MTVTINQLCLRFVVYACSAVRWSECNDRYDSRQLSSLGNTCWLLWRLICIYQLVLVVFRLGTFSAKIWNSWSSVVTVKFWLGFLFWWIVCCDYFNNRFRMLQYFCSILYIGTK